jgi:hypothetical protein
MQRLKDAGLNPNLIYGSSPAGASGSAGSIAPSKAAPYAFRDPTQSIAQMDLLRAQKDNLDANTFKTNEGGFLTKEQKEILQGTKDSQILIKQYEADKAREEAITAMYNKLELSKSFQKRVDILSELVKQNKSQTALKQLDEMFAKENNLRSNDPYWARMANTLYKLLTGKDQDGNRYHNSQAQADEIKRKYKENFKN